jgi:hypothetical protein
MSSVRTIGLLVGEKEGIKVAAWWGDKLWLRVFIFCNEI